MPKDRLHRLELTTSDNVKLAAMLALQPQPKQRPTILYLHGQGGHIDHFWRFAQALWDAGYNVIVLDFRGFGCSEGAPTEAGLYQDGLAALTALRKHKDIDPNRLVIWGFSLGSGVASWLAAREQVAAVVLEAPYTSMAAMVEGAGPFSSPAWWVSDVQFDTLGRIGKSRSPVLVAHGDADRRIPFRMGKAVFAAAPAPKRLVVVPDADHGDVIPEALPAVLANLALIAPAAVAPPP